jgi:ATP adenylyltransferase
VIYQSIENPFSYLTAKHRTAPSFPLRQLLSKGLVHGRVLDFGSGLGTDVAYLLKYGIDAEAFDPHYAPELPNGRYDTILCTYVLNVLLPIEQAHVLMAISEILTPSGNAFLTVRRDIQRGGYRTHVIHQAKVYQCNVILPFQSILSTKHCEIYHYRHINQREVRKHEECKFCNPDSTLTLITESATAYAIQPQFPSTPGHSLIVPKPHIAQYLDLPERNKTACWLMIDRVKSILERMYNPIGFRIHIDVNASDHHTVSHAHIHLLPIYPLSPISLIAP